MTLWLNTVSFGHFGERLEHLPVSQPDSLIILGTYFTGNDVEPFGVDEDDMRKRIDDVGTQTDNSDNTAAGDDSDTVIQGMDIYLIVAVDSFHGFC